MRPVLRHRGQSKEIGTKGRRTAMFGITSETIRQFSLAEILLLIAMNIETSRLASENRVRLATGAGFEYLNNTLPSAQLS